MRRTNSSAKRTRVMGVLGAVALALLAGTGAALAGEPQPWQIDFQPAASPTMEKIRDLNILLTIIVVGISIFVLCLIGYICIRFRESRSPAPSKTSHNTVLEVVWTVVPIMILVIIAIPSFKLLYFADRATDAQMTIKAVGHQWYWEYEYADITVDEEPITFEATIACRGDATSAEDVEACKDFEEANGRKPVRLLDTDTPVVLPIQTDIRLLITAAPDGVLHSWAIPAFGVKLDAVPGRINETWVRIEREGTYYGQCSELCGKDHGFMPIWVKAVSKEDYAAWQEQAKEEFAGVRRGTEDAVQVARQGARN